MLELGVIADDLTGGMMVASLLEREGVRCPLVTSVRDKKSQLVRVSQQRRGKPIRQKRLRENAKFFTQL